MIPLRDSIRARKFSLVNSILIAINIIIFAYQLRLQANLSLDSFIQIFAVVPSRLIEDPARVAYSLITSQFLHGGLFHLLGNMLYLYIFGDNVEDRLGYFSYLCFYIFCGVSAALFQIYFNPQSSLPLIGASGAIAGVLGAYFVFYPHAKILTLIPFGFFSRIIEVPAYFFLGFWFVLQAFSGTNAYYMSQAAGREVGGVAWWAHLGGFIAGVAIAGLLRFKRAYL